jgi:hypothetical protein
VQGTEAWNLGISTLPWPARHVQKERKFERRFSDSAIGVSIAGTAERTETMTPDTTLQEVDRRKTRRYPHDTLFRITETETKKDQARVRAPSSARELRNSKGWKQLRIKHWDLQDLRISYKKQRELLLKEQQEMCAIDDQFLRKLQKVEFVAFEDMKIFVVEILKHYEILQQARSAVALEQAEYEKLECKLVENEHELRDLESHMYRFTTAESAGTLEQQDEPMPGEEDPTESVVSSQNIQTNQSVEAQQYLSQKGDVDILREQLMDLRVYHSQVTAEQADRRDAGLKPDKALTVFLDGFDQQHEVLVLQVRDAEELLAEYENALRVPDDRYSQSEGPSHAHSLFGEDDYVDDSVLEAGRMEDDRLAATANAFLFSQSDSASVYGLLGIGSEDDSVGKALYINSWLLHHLRSSTGKVARLVAEHMKYGIQLEPSDFKEKVLANWLQDDNIPIYDLSRFAIHSHDYSMATVSGNTQNSRPASENVLQSGQQNAFSLQRQLSARHTQTER